MSLTYTSQRAIRSAFRFDWELRCRDVPAYRSDLPAKRMAFTCFVDSLARDGQITEALADRVTLAPTAKDSK
jgi:hypothetical protein